MWWETAGLLDRQTEAAIRADAQGLSERWMEGGLPALVLTIDDRLAQNVDDDAIYLLVDAQFKRLAGNLRRWPEGVAGTGEPYALLVERAGVRSLARVQEFDLPGEFHLLVGRDVRVRAQLRSLLTDALLWAFLVVLAMATVGALVVRSLFRLYARERFGDHRGGLGGRSFATGAARGHGRRVRSPRRDDQRHARPHCALDGRGAAGIERDRT